MEDKLTKAKNILIKYNQEHLIQFYDELDKDKQDFLIDQILSINFEKILNLYEKKSKIDMNESIEEIEPLPYTDKNKIPEDLYNSYCKIGENTISSKEFAVITLAGGQGSRLGFKGPKGTFELDTKPRKSLFEILCDYLKEACCKFDITIPWYIMTSSENHEATVKFFKEHDFFGYDENNIFFFIQENLPLIDIDKKLVLEELHKIKVASNGNGNLFKSLKKYNIIDALEKNNIKWVFVGGVDNVLLNPLDPLFLGITIDSGNHISSKTLFKDNPESTEWIFAKTKNKPGIVDCENFASEVSKIKDANGNYLYRETNMLAHIFSIDALKHMQNKTLPYHRAFRKSAFVNYEGMKQVPESPNIYKFEQFVFDAFSEFDNITLLRVNADEEFAPIKDFNGPYNPEIAQKLYEKNVLHIESNDDD